MQVVNSLPCPMEAETGCGVGEVGFVVGFAGMGAEVGGMDSMGEGRFWMLEQGLQGAGSVGVEGHAWMHEKEKDPSGLFMTFNC